MRIFSHHPRSSILYAIMVLIVVFTPISTQPLTMTHLQQSIVQTNRSPFVNLLFIYDSATQTGRSLQSVIPMITQKKANYYKVHLLDCNTQDEEVIKAFPYCASDMRSKLPALAYTQPALNSYNPQTKQYQDAKQHQYQGPLDQKSLYDFAIPLMKAYSVSLTKMSELTKWQESLPVFEETQKNIPYVLYFTDKDKLPTIYKTLTTNFRETLAFGHVLVNKQKNSSSINQLIEHYKITKFPTMLVFPSQQTLESQISQEPIEIKLTKNLQQMIEKLKPYQSSQSQKIYISQFLTMKSSVIQLTKENIQENVYEKQEHVLIHVPNLQNDKQHLIWKQAQKKFKKMFAYYQVLSDDKQLIQQLGVKQTPALVYFPKSLKKKNVQKTVFYSKSTFRDVYSQIQSLIQDFTVPMANDMQMQRLTSLPLQQGKIIAVLYHDEEISLSYRVLSNHDLYKKDIVFFRMRNPQQAVVDKFKIQKLPSLFIMMNDQSKKQGQSSQDQEEQMKQGQMKMNLQIAQYTGKFNYDDLSQYLNMFIQKPQKTQAQKSAQQAQQTKQGKLHHISTKKQFSKYCIEQNCFALLVDGRQSKKESLQEYKQLIKRFAGRTYEPFVVIDALCHSQIIQPLEIQSEQLPTFVYLNSKFEKFSRLIGRIQERSVNNFIGKIRSNKGVNYRSYEKISFDNGLDCEQIHLIITDYEKGTNTQQAGLNQVQLQILKQIKEQQEQKQKQINQLSKNTQKKKKRKRRPKNQEQSSDEL